MARLSNPTRGSGDRFETDNLTFKNHPLTFEPRRYGQYTYPESGSVLVSVFDEGNEANASPNARIKWSIDCENEGFCGSFCDNNLKDIVDFATSLGGVPGFGSLFCAFC